LSSLAESYLKVLEKKAEATSKKGVTATAVQAEYWNNIQSFTNKFFSGTPSPYRPKKKKVTERFSNIILSDLHYGSDLDSRVTPFKYGPVEEARRTAAIGVQVADYKRQYRDQTELNVHLIGDIIQGNLHDPRAAAPLAEQWTRALSNLRQVIDFWSREFKQVTVRCVTGNHGRTKSRHPERGVDGKWDSEEFKLYQGLAGCFHNYPNVAFEIGLRPYYVCTNFGMKSFFTHGDTVLNVGFPSSSINVKAVSTQINKINGKLEGHERYSLFGVGHVHTASATHLPNEVLVTNGCLVPPDEYALSIGLLDNVCIQQMYETVPGHIFGDCRGLKVDHKTDQDASLDKIVRPFQL